jgi:hypothetical protein
MYMFVRNILLQLGLVAYYHSIFVVGLVMGVIQSWQALTGKMMPETKILHRILVFMTSLKASYRNWLNYLQIY